MKTADRKRILFLLLLLDIIMKEGGGKKAVSPCAACKLLRRRCAPDCIFAPYFPADDPHKFASVHKVFGASSVNKMLQVPLFLPLSLCNNLQVSSIC